MSASIRIAAGPHDVWSVITDLDQASTNITSILTLERIGSSQGYSIGTRWRETRRVCGATASEEMEVIEAIPPTRTRVFASSHGADYLSGFTVDVAGEHTRLTMDFIGTPSPQSSRLFRTVFKLTAKLSSSSTRKAMKKDLADIKRAAEALSDADVRTPSYDT